MSSTTVKSTAAMVDLETVSTKTNGVIIQLGVIIFDPNGSRDELVDSDNNLLVPNFCVNITQGTQIGRHIDPKTIKWWGSNLEKAKIYKEIIEDKNSLHLINALTDFRTFIKLHKPKFIWANSPSFDCAMLRSSYETTGLAGIKDEGFPFTPWKEMDCRTLETFVFDENCRKPGGLFHWGEAHNAIDDCVMQSLMVMACNKIKAQCKAAPGNLWEVK